MSKRINYSTMYLDHKEEAILQFILSLDNTQEKTPWTYTTTNDAPLVIIGNGSSDSSSTLSSKINGSQIVLSLGNKTINNVGKKVLFVNAPLQAREVIEQLEYAETLISANKPETSQRSSISKRVENTSKIKLIAWPNPELLMRHSINTALATLLNKEAMSIKELSEKVQYPEMSCRQFVEAALKMGYALVLLPVHDDPSLDTIPSPEKAPPRKGLFASLGFTKSQS